MSQLDSFNGSQREVILPESFTEDYISLDIDMCIDKFFENYWKCNWQNFGYIVISIPSIPLYIMVLVTICKERLKRESPFNSILYTILMSQVGITLRFAK